MHEMNVPLLVFTATLSVTVFAWATATPSQAKEQLSAAAVAATLLALPACRCTAEPFADWQDDETTPPEPPSCGH